MLYIHIGTPKTGSSAIQAFLTLNHDKFLEKGILFPNPPNFEQAFQTSSGNANSFYKLFIDNDIDKIKNLIDLYNSKTVILSSEYFFDILIRYPERFFDVFNTYDYKVIIYVRRQDNLISSLLNQHIKNSYGISYHIIGDITKTHDFTKVLLNSLNYTEVDKFIVRPYEKQQFYEGNIYSDFLNCIGLELDNDFVYPEKIVNPSLNWDALEFRRILNILEVDKDNIKNKFFVNELLAKYTVENNKGKPFQDDNIFSPKERIEIINAHKEKNEQVARVFLNREKLFYDSLPDINNDWKPHDKLTLEKALNISKFILNTKYKDNLEEELIKSIAKGTIDRLLGNEQFKNIKDKTLIYSLNTEPVNLSKDISKLEKKLDFWYIESSGNDPHFIIPELNEIDGEIYIRIEITSSTNTVLQLFYISDNNNFDSTHCLTQGIQKGYNEIILKLQEKEPIKSLRLDTANTEGIYLLHSFEVRK